MRLKKISGVILSAALVAGMCSTAFAADNTSAEYENGAYTGTIHFMNGSNPEKASMCDSIFAHEADVTLSDDTAELTFYVAYPVPNFADQGADGTIKDVVMTLDGTTYTGESDLTTKAVKTFDTDGNMFGITAGDELTTQAVTVDLPRSAVDSFEEGIATSAYVNIVMNTTQNFYAKVTDLTKANSGSDTGNTTTDSKEMEITANIEKKISEPAYTVTVPESAAMGTLNRDKDNKVKYDVTVTATDLNGILSVTTPTAGELTSGSNKLAFANSFGTQQITEDTTAGKLSGELSVSADAVKAAAAGNYTGTTTFTISYVGK